MRVIVLLNSAAGANGRPAPAEIVRLLAHAGVAAEVRSVPGSRLSDEAARAQAERPDALVAAGGDGTISTLAARLIDSPVPLGILPVGTLNHFAKDLGLPLDLAAAARVIAAGNIRRIDIGEVNGHTFVNNSSIGLYPRIVTHRDEQRQRLVRGKWLAMAFAIVAVFRRYPMLHAVLETDGAVLPRVTPFVFIGNNAYNMNLLAMGARPRLDGGVLGLYCANRTGRFGLLRLMFRSLLGRLNQARDFDVLSPQRVRIDTRRKSLRVALDGEVLTLVPPLHYRILPGRLRVLAPGRSPT
jgi:diacylglycerol kinase family enzyme